jgi:hypothetical protein
MLLLPTLYNILSWRPVDRLVELIGCGKQMEWGVALFRQSFGPENPLYCGVSFVATWFHLVPRSVILLFIIPDTSRMTTNVGVWFITSIIGEENA